MIVKGSDEEAVLLNRCLGHECHFIDAGGIFVTLTQENEKVREVAKSYGANISFYQWDDDYAKVRNFNFSQVPKKFTHVLWMDVDDVFRGLGELDKIVVDHPETDAFLMNYLYWFDENKNPVTVHTKIQVLKNDGCLVWKGQIHEDLMATRIIKSKMIENIERIHLSSDERLKESRERNLRIAEKQVKEDPTDPRTWWNLGRAQVAMAIDESVNTLEKFISLTRSDDDKYLARLGIGDYWFVRGEYGKALDNVRYAIGLKPEYPDAYTRAGHIYFEMRNFDKARDFYLLGLTKKPPIYTILVYNPRDYDYTPLMALAKTYFKLSLPSLALTCLKGCMEILPGDKKLKDLIKMMEKESKKFDRVVNHLKNLQEIKDIDKLKEEMDKLPDEVRSHPAVCHLRNVNFIKKTSTGKDLVFYCSYTSEEWTPETAIEKGIGGSERAVINLTKILHQQYGWNVTVYNNCGYKELEFEGVKYKPFWSWNYRDKQDVVILWRHPKPCDYEINAPKVYIDLHDVVGEGEFNESRMKRIEKILVKSKAQRDLFPKLPDDKFLIIPNGVDLEQFNLTVERDPYYLINLSSPDRSLNAILDLLPQILERVPEEIAKKVKFGWYYGWQVFDASLSSEKEQEWKRSVIDKFEKLKKLGVAQGGGRISHLQIPIELLKAGALIYPTHFYEIDYLGGTEAQIAGCVPITTDFAALDEKIQFGVKIPSGRTRENWSQVEICDFGIKDEKSREMFVKAVADYLKNPNKFDREKMSKWAKEKYDIKKIASLWNEELSKPKLFKAHVKIIKP